MQMITNTKDLAALCAKLGQSEFVTVDTEFMRDKTYWPKLCLIQIAGDDSQVAIIDPLVEGIDLAPFYELMRHPGVIKVVHAGRQDVEIFHHMGNTIPTPLFDTQIAAMACGFSDSVGYETLVNKLTGNSLDKSTRFSDWSRRPLKDNQLAYAAGDVTYLREIYTKLSEKLRQTNREAWLAEEMEELCSPATYNLDPDRAWKRLKLRGPARKNLGILMEVAAWRERQAQSRDLPRNRVMKDDLIYEIVGRKPKTLRDLEELRFGSKGLAKSSGAEDLLRAVKRGLAMPKEQWPDLPPPSSPTTKNNGSLVDLLKVLLKMTSENYGVAQKLISNVSDLEKIAQDGEAANVAALHGWRLEVFGQQALDLKAGKIALTLDDDRVQTITRPGV